MKKWIVDPGYSEVIEVDDYELTGTEGDGQRFYQYDNEDGETRIYNCAQVFDDPILAKNVYIISLKNRIEDIQREILLQEESLKELYKERDRNESKVGILSRFQTGISRRFK